MTTEMPAVQVGQVWADNDKRCAGRTVRIVEVDETHATTETIRGRRTRIRLARFRPTSTGYRLISNPPEESP